MIRHLSFLAIFFLFISHIMAECFEPFDNLKYSVNRYNFKEIRAINKDGTDIEKIKVWVNTPQCWGWIDMGCIEDKFLREHCSYGGILNPGLNCYKIERCTLHHVFDREFKLNNDAPARNEISSCFTARLKSFIKYGVFCNEE